MLEYSQGVGNHFNLNGYPSHIYHSPHLRSKSPWPHMAFTLAFRPVGRLGYRSFTPPIITRLLWRLVPVMMILHKPSREQFLPYETRYSSG